MTDIETVRQLLDAPINQHSAWFEGEKYDEDSSLYVWAIRMSKSISHEIPMRGFTKEENLCYWAARSAARKMSAILLNFVRENDGQEVDADMIEEMRKICARITYD